MCAAIRAEADAVSVASIRQHAEVALAHPEQTTVTELAGTVLAEDVRVQSLIEDLLLLARADEAGLWPRWHPVGLDDLVLEETRLLRAATSLQVDATGVSAGRVDGDAAGLRRVLRNLGENADRRARGGETVPTRERAPVVPARGTGAGGHPASAVPVHDDLAGTGGRHMRSAVRREASAPTGPFAV